MKPRSSAPYFSHAFDTPMAPMLAIASDNGLTLLEFQDRPALAKEMRQLRDLGDVTPGDHPILTQTVREMHEYLAGERREFTIPLDLRGTPFELEAWNQLLRIPYGQTRSYADMARAIGRPGASRAIGRANGANRVGVVVPCHRVIRSDGALCGYGGGIHRKQQLLELEGARTPEPALFGE